MTFASLLDGVEVLSQSGSAQVRGLAYDSRRVQPGWLFVAMRGETTDGNRYIDAALSAGAVAVATDAANETPRAGVAWAVVSHGRRALARLSANFFHHPENRLQLAGITGTNGKTTTSFLFEAMLAAAGRKSVLIGTVEYHVAGKVLPAPHTTPEPLELEQLLAEAVANGATDGVMEVSSHALAQQRVYGIPFAVAIFTNLTRDHLDYHGDFDAYFAAKRALFEGLGTGPPAFAVLNADDAFGARLIAEVRSQVLTYGIEKGQYRAERLEITGQGSRFDVETPLGRLALWTPLIGRVNVYNALAAVAAGVARGLPARAMVEGIAALKQVPGRFQRVDEGQPFAVVVDYAHTDDALRNLTTVARDFVARDFVARDGGRGRVITLFGCGGDRDKQKRPLMGAAAGQGSDFVVLTSDNPRSEDPMAIIGEALPGLAATGTRHAVEPDRRKAIALAVAEAKPGDIVLVAGKGHEDYQVTRAGTSPFSDAEEARAALRALGYGAAKAGAK
jgi:UDP-N-acetylmuramoyl-L-alanyl-D-glutamate--2,6-diaminopimelate ligase